MVGYPVAPPLERVFWYQHLFQNEPDANFAMNWQASDLEGKPGRRFRG
jgi:hypothetical protein